MEDLIRKLNLPVAKDQQYSETQKSYYADCHGNFIVAVFNQVREAEKQPTFYEVIHKSENDFLIFPHKYGYALIGNACGYDQYGLAHAFAETKQKAAFIHTPSFKRQFREWVDEYPHSYERDDVQACEKQHTLFFMNDWDFLLLDDDKEIRDLYTEFREKDYRYYCSYMSCSR